jgi:hypothetical protein
MHRSRLTGSFVSLYFMSKSITGLSIAVLLKGHFISKSGHSDGPASAANASRVTGTNLIIF